MHNGISDYRSMVGSNEIEEIKMIARRLEGARMLHINSTFEGGGVAEILTRLVPLMRNLGINASWDVIKGGDDFFEVTKAFHNALHGKETRVREKMFQIYKKYTDLNISLFDKEADFYFIHDPQPAGLVQKKDRFPGSHWIWRCHIDVSMPNRKVWDFLENHVVNYDASIFSMPEFSRHLPIPQYIITPSIDPLSDKNKELEPKYIAGVLEKRGIDPDRPIITQISRFDRLKDPVGVIEAYRMAKKKIDCQLVLAGGGAADDPEGVAVLNEVKEITGGDPDAKILELPPFSDTEINALQRASTVVIQKSLREGFGLTVTEALWKGKPVIGSAVGGIKAQIVNGVTGFLVHSVEGCAKRIEELLVNPEKRRELGNNGRELVRNRFLITRHLKNYLLLMFAMQYSRNPEFAHERIIALE